MDTVGQPTFLNCYVQPIDPGAVGRELCWLNPLTGEFKIRNIDNTAWISVGGGSLGQIALITPPIDGEWTSFNFTGSTRTLSEIGSILINSPSNGSLNNLRMVLHDLPAPPYEVIVGYMPVLKFQQFSGAGCGFRESSTGKLAYVRTLATGATGLIFHYGQWNSESSGNLGDYIGQVVCGWWPWPLVFVKLADNGVNRITSWGPDGENFVLQHTIGRLDHLLTGANQVFVASEPFDQPAGVSLKSYRRIL